MAATKSIKITNESYIDTIAPCVKIAVERNAKYGNSIDVCSNWTIMELVQMKLERNKTLAASDPKYIDEIRDSVNYLVYILMRVKQKHEVVNPLDEIETVIRIQAHRGNISSLDAGHLVSIIEGIRSKQNAS